MRRDFVFNQELRMTQQDLPGGGCVLTPQGALDSATSDEFKNRVQKYLDEQTRTPDLLLDLSGVRYISSIGLGALIQLLKRSQQTRTVFALYDPQLAVRRVLEISKLDFLIVKPEETASLGVFCGYVLDKESQRPNPAPRAR